jgi:uncharacterized protein YtpQ (UPF0354 family)
MLSELLPQFFPEYWRSDVPDLVFSEFPSSIRIGYLLKMTGGYRYLMRPQLEESGLSLEEVHAAAIRNLDELPLAGVTVGKTPGGSEAWLGDSEDNFHAARILLPRVQQALRDELGESFFVALPCRDWFVCWSKEQASGWQAKNRADVLKTFREDEHRLTPDVLLFSGGSFALALAQDPEDEVT